MEHLIKDALAAGTALAAQQAVGDGPGKIAVLPEGYEVQSLEKFGLTPDRKRGIVKMNDAKSFVEFFNMHADTHSSIYASVNPPGFVGVINDHGTDPAWRDFRVEYSCPHTAEWLEWTRNDKKAMKQSEFAAFIESNLPDIFEPSGADMLEISRTLEAKKKVNFASGIRLANGQQELTYEEDIQGTASKGKLQIPETFKIGIQVLEGGEPYAIECRLRYRINDANLVMWYELVRPHKILEDAAKAVWEQIAVDTNRRIYNGSI
ncbi:DUF2303 family protein [Neopusillimonas maritima]|uniref:DUF2303 domain-containing protein n=1 Tax=Neopusillimonas maritima TaxID=2026239 RepID=A0A3A1YYU5_9BURK|nr:DUF2303 family protein [Neopusillimonas maritima]RIY41980.1 hypothetical protein CJP73_00600 [Neopusillimonas maritima]